jgi:hypothetical protein
MGARYDKQLQIWDLGNNKAKATFIRRVTRNTGRTGGFGVPKELLETNLWRYMKKNVYMRITVEWDYSGTEPRI